MPFGEDLPLTKHCYLCLYLCIDFRFAVVLVAVLVSEPEIVVAPAAAIVSNIALFGKLLNVTIVEHEQPEIAVVEMLPSGVCYYSLQSLSPPPVPTFEFIFECEDVPAVEALGDPVARRSHYDQELYQNSENPCDDHDESLDQETI